MNSITIDNEKYVKATDIARELGYTADYVGQLCRAQKVDSQLVGRSWYVSEESLRSHKKTRYRSTATANKKTIATSLQAKDMDEDKTFAVAVSVEDAPQVMHYAEQSFYTRSPQKPAPSYSLDESDLLPTSSKVKTGRLSVSLGDSQKVTIKSQSKEFDFNPIPRQEVRFSGSLAVKDIYEENASDEEGEVEENEAEKIEPVKLSIAKAVPETIDISPEITSKIKVKHIRKDSKSKKKSLPLEHNTAGVLGMRRERIVDRNPIGGTLKVSVPASNPSVASTGVYFIVISTVISVVLSLVIVGLQADLYAQGPTLITSYTFEIKELLAAVYSAW